MVNSAHVIKNNTMVEGEIVASKNPDNPNDPKDLEVTAIFTNTQRKLINIEFDKLWKDANGNGPWHNEPAGRDLHPAPAPPGKQHRLIKTVKPL